MTRPLQDTRLPIRAEATQAWYHEGMNAFSTPRLFALGDRVARGHPAGVQRWLNRHPAFIEGQLADAFVALTENAAQLAPPVQRTLAAKLLGHATDDQKVTFLEKVIENDHAILFDVANAPEHRPPADRGRDLMHLALNHGHVHLVRELLPWVAHDPMYLALATMADTHALSLMAVLLTSPHLQKEDRCQALQVAARFESEEGLRFLLNLMPPAEQHETAMTLAQQAQEATTLPDRERAWRALDALALQLPSAPHTWLQDKRLEGVPLPRWRAWSRTQEAHTQTPVARRRRPRA
jgi:hypothetical protein